MRVLVVSPHPDDETLGAGGTLLRLKEENHQIYWLNITDVSEECGWDAEFVEKRTKQIKKICQFYGFEKSYNLKFPPAQLEKMGMGELIGQINQCINDIQPQWIILPDYNDAHSDHKIVFECCMACTKSFRCSSVRRITTMEILSETNFGKPYDKFEPTFYVDISNVLEKKIEAMEIYDSEIGEHPFPRSKVAINSLAMLRGIEAGVVAAEAFRTIKEIV